MPEVKSRRELYSEATRAVLLEEATALFAERRYAVSSLEDVASASQVTRGAVYHHFASKQALFEAVLDLQEARVTAEVIAAASTADPWDAAMLALDTYLTHCCDPVERDFPAMAMGTCGTDRLVRYPIWPKNGSRQAAPNGGSASILL
jgi:AcrR family transcriptional regulator